ncbi:MAG: fucose 4-O-acetylase-like acetyltransferase [Maribacter sp.]|jgi:fucose 4-O-acetylase-like acetyltransferase
MKEFFDNWKLIILLCLTLGLAPFFPEPHLWGKLKWVAGGAVGLEAMDWFDFLFHGFPFLLLIRVIALSFFKK